ncbi:hypothetical protein FB45DRAFT_980034 [Roridomyces roridus]|uniref:AMP-dependent synthetase/ligase domain-containing protein n=1 Tax=Roridomyces roridus TaxID=1738132 RepID=A0AAD7BM96_9AGAR|nr:hypothetical protein FB45DRAFT_980034 [Roridomyces roridus]
MDNTLDLELNHIALLQDRALTRGGTILFKIPKSGFPQEWVDVTVAVFSSEVDQVACTLLADLQAKEIPSRSVIGMLMDGRPYLDFVYTIALSRLGYVPLMIPPRSMDESIISELMRKAETKAIVYDASLVSSITNYALAATRITPINDIACDSSSLPSIQDLPSDTDVCFIYLTSGSTSGSPKLVPITQRFVTMNRNAEVDTMQDDNKDDIQDVFLNRGKYLVCLFTGSCIVYPPRTSTTTQDLFTLVDICGLNRMAMFGTFLSPHIQAAMGDQATLELLKGMRSISYSGVHLPIVEDDWCFHNGIHLVGMYAMTECGARLLCILMTTVPGKPSRYLRPIPTISCRFDPVSKTDDQSAADHESTQLFEFILLAGSPRLPQSHLLAPDGHFHSGDLFEDQPDGSYVFRGRNDDWIKTKSAYWCDTKSIEDKVHETCGDLIKQCIVVGSFRPSPALFIEPNAGSPHEHESLKDTILARMHEFNIRCYVSESITDKRLIFVVDQGVLPRTMKGNLRHAAIEHQYSTMLDEVYESLSV